VIDKKRKEKGKFAHDYTSSGATVNNKYLCLKKTEQTVIAVRILVRIFFYL